MHILKRIRKGVDLLKKSGVERCILLGDYIVSTGSTVRNCATKFGISKSTVHKDVTKRLKIIDYDLYNGVNKILQFNKEQRHIRGGLATQRKYKIANLHKTE